MNIRRAEEKDLQKVNDLLMQVLAIHADIRPDIFIPGTKKYTDEELLAIFADESRPVFVAEDENGDAAGYMMCAMQKPAHSNNMCDIKTLYVDDLCVDEKYRGMHIASELLAHVKRYAKEAGCHNITLNVWEGNDSARGFYEKSGFGIQKTTMEMILK